MSDKPKVPEVRGFADADFPGYRAAVAREQLVRAAACLGIRPDICGHEVLPLTAHHVRHLGFARSPFLLTGLTAEQLSEKPGIVDDILRFCWIVSPMFEMGVVERKRGKWNLHWHRPTAKDRFNAAFAGLMREPALKVLAEIISYIEDAFLDAESGGGPGNDKTFYADEIAIVEELGEAGYRKDFLNPLCPRGQNPVHLPLAIVFQIRKLRRQKKGDVITNKSERFIAEGLSRINLNN